MMENESQTIVDELMETVRNTPKIIEPPQYLPTVNSYIKVKLCFPQFPDISTEEIYTLKYYNIIGLEIIKYHKIVAENRWFNSKYYDGRYIQLKSISLKNDATTSKDVLNCSMTQLNYKCKESNFPISLHNTLSFLKTNNYIKLTFRIITKGVVMLKTKGIRYNPFLARWN